MQKNIVALAAVFFAVLSGIVFSHTIHAADGSLTGTITTVSPNTAATSGGDTVTLKGSGFTSDSAVFFNDTAAVTTYVDENTLTVTAPAAYKGVKDVKVKNAAGTTYASLPAAFTSLAPAATVTSVSPPTGEADKPHSVVIQGSGFEAGYRRSITYQNATSSDITWTPLSVQLNTAALVSAGKMKQDGSDIRFTDTAGSEIRYYIQSGMNTATTTILIDTPTITPGAHTLYMNYGYPSAAAQSSDFTSTYPNNTPVTKTFTAQELYVAYATTNQNTCKTWASPAGRISSFTVNHATEAKYDFFIVSADDVQVYKDSGSITKTVSLPTPAKTLKACLTTDGSNNGGFGGQVTQVVYSGMAVKNDVTIGNDEQPTLRVDIDGASVPIASVTATSVSVTVPAHAAGQVNVAVTNPYGYTGTASNAYTYDLAPTVQSIVPDTAVTAGGDTVIVSGGHFSRYSTVSFNGIAAQAVTFINDTTLSVVTPASYKGVKDIAVQNGPQGGIGALNGAFTMVAPAASLTSVTPATGVVGKENYVTVNGSGFEAGYKRAVTYANTTGSTISNTVLAVTLDTASLVTRGNMNATGSDIRFTDERGSEVRYFIKSGMNSATTSIYVNVPDITPGAHTVYLFYGYPSATAQSSDFTGNIPNTSITKSFTDQELYVPYTSTNQNVCKSWTAGAVNASITSFNVNLATETNYDYFIVNADGVQVYKSSGSVASATVNLATPAKTLQACLTTDNSNQSGFGGQVTQVTYNGVNVKSDAVISDTVTPGLVVSGNGKMLSAYNITPTSFATTLSASQAGTTDITVTNPYSRIATMQNAFAFTDDGITIGTVVPRSGTVTGGDIVTVKGSNFTSGTKVRLNDTLMQNVTIVDAGTITFVTPSWAHAIPVDVTVESANGQKATQQDAFAFKDPAMTINSLNPSSGPTSGNQAVTLNGNAFTDGYAYMTAISTASDHTCGIYSGKAYCWGNNGNGQLGNNSTTNSATPVPVDTSSVLSGLNIISISTATGYTCAVASDNQVYCWGLNSSSQLGDGTTISRKIPVLKTGLNGKTVTSVSISTIYGCVVADGHAYCWGSNASGQLGDGDSSASVKQLSTVKTDGVLSGVNLVQLAAGTSSVCAVSDAGKAYCWGLNTSGQLGNGSSTSTNVPVFVDETNQFDGKKVTDITVGSTHACAIASATLYCWGANTNGKTGTGVSSGNTTLPQIVKDSSARILTNVSDVALSTNSSCAVVSLTVSCWGDNTDGQLGTNNNTAAPYPTAVSTAGALAGKTVRSITAGGTNGTSHTCVIVQNEQSVCWGDNGQQALGNGTSADSLVPVQTVEQTLGVPIVSFDGATVPITSRDTSRLAITTPQHASGQVNVRVARYDGATATSTYLYSSNVVVTGVTPRSGLISGGDTVSVTGTGFTSNMTLKLGGVTVPTQFINDGSLTFNVPAMNYSKDVAITIIDQYGQSIDAGTYSYVLPQAAVLSATPPTGPLTGGQSVTISGQNFFDAGEYAKQVGSGDNFSCAIYLDDQVYCWGNNASGQLGNGSTTNSSAPVAVTKTGVLSGKKIVSIAVGYNSVCAIGSDAQVYCWGSNAYGQLGNGSTTSSSVPVALSGASAARTYKQVSVGFTTGCAVTSDDLAYCWGSTSSGMELGANLNVPRYVPTPVYTNDALSGKTIKKISVGYQNSCVIASDSQSYCWGYNGYGMLGTGTTSSSAKPVATVTNGVLAGKILMDISTYNGHTCAVATDNTLYCWGSNGSGQLGDGTTTGRTSPVTVPLTGVLSGKKIIKVVVGTAQTCVLADDGTAFCWGSNAYGQLGANKTATQSVSPLQVDTNVGANAATLSQLSAGSIHGCALGANGKIYCWGNNATGALASDVSIVTSSFPISTQQPSIVPKVTVGGVAATNVSRASSTELKAVTPAHAAGSVPIGVQNYSGTESSRSSAYTYAPPLSVSSIVPNRGLVTGGDTVTVTGEGFSGQTKIKVNGQYVERTILIDSNTLQFVTPASATPGVATVTVEDEFGQQTNVSGGFTYLLAAPTLSSIDPAAVSSDGNKTVTIRGSGFVQKQNGGTWYAVSFGGTAGTNVAYVDSGTLTVTVPAHAAGKVDVVIGGDYVTPVTAPNAFTYLASKYAFSNGRLNLDTGASGMLTVSAYDSTNTVTPSPVDTVISLASSSKTGQFATDLGEDASTRWSHTSVVLPAGRSSVDVWYKDGTSGTPVVTGTIAASAQTFTQTQTIDSPYRLALSGISNPIQAGDPSSVTVRVIDRSGFQMTDFTGTIHFTSTDPTAQLPPDYAFTSSDYGIKTFTNGVSFGSQGTYAVRATSTADAVITGFQGSIRVNAANQGTASKLSFISPAQRVQAGRYSAPITLQLQDSGGNGISVSSATTLYYYASSPTAEFSTDTTTWSRTQPFAVTLPAGATTVNIYYRDSSATTADLTVKDQAVADGPDYGLIDASQKITTGLSPPTRLNVTGPSSLKKGTKGTYTVQLQDEAGNVVSAVSDVTLRIDASDTGAQFYSPATAMNGNPGPYEFVIPGGTSSVTVGFIPSITANNDHKTSMTLVDGRPSTETIRLASATVQMQVVDDYETALSITSTGSTLKAGEPSALTIGLRTGSDAEASATRERRVALTSNSQTAQFSLTASPFVPVSSVTIQEGQKTAAVFVRDTATGSLTIAANSTGLTTGSTQINAVASSVFRYALSKNTLSAELNAVSEPVTITGYDMYGNVAQNTSATAAYLYGNNDNLQYSDSASGPWTGNSVVIPAGATSATFYVKPTTFSDTLTTLTVSDAAALDSPDTGIQNVTMTVKTTSQKAGAIRVTTETQNITAGETTDKIEVILEKTDGTAALQDGSTSVSVSVGSGSLKATPNGTQSISSLAIPRGQNKATMYYSGTKAGTYAITATAPSAATSTQQAITVAPADASKIVFKSMPQSINPDVASAVMTIELQDAYGNPAPSTSDRAVALASNCANGSFSLSAGTWQPTSSIRIPSGSSTGTFYYKNPTPGNCTVTATSEVMDAAQQQVAIASYAIKKIDITSAQQTVVAGRVSNAITVALRKDDGTPAYQNGTTSLNLDGGTLGSFVVSSTDLTPRSSVSIAAGSAEATLYYASTKAGDSTMTISLPGGVTASQSIRITAAEVTHATFVTPPRSTTMGSPSNAIRIELRDQHENVATAAVDTNVRLTSSCQTGTFSVNQTQWQPTESVAMQAGSTDMTFYYKSAASGTCTISAQPEGVDVISQNVVVASDAYPSSIKITTDGATHIRGDRQSLTISLLDQYGNVTQAKVRTSIRLSSSVASQFSTTNVVFQPGESTHGITYESSVAGQQVVTAADVVTAGDEASDMSNDSATVTYVDGAVKGVQLSGDSSAKAGGAYRLTLHPVNANDVVIAAPDALTVTLSSNGSGAFNNESGQMNVVINAGTSSAEAVYTQTAAGAVTFVATGANGSASKPVSFLPNEAYEIRFTSPAYVGSKALEIGARGSVAIQLYDMYGNVTSVSANTTLYVTALNKTTGTAKSSTMVIPAGSTTGTYQFSSTEAGEYTLSISDSASGDGVFQTITQSAQVVAGEAAGVSFVQKQAEIERGATSSALSVQLTNTAGVPVAAAKNTTIHLEVASGKGLLASSQNGPWSSEIDVSFTVGQLSRQFYFRSDAATMSEGDGSLQVLKASTTLNASTQTDTMDVAVRYGNAAQLKIVTPSRTQQANHPSAAITVELQNQYGKAVLAAEDIPLYVRSSSETARFGSSKTTWGITSVVIKRGQSTADIYFQDSKTGSPSITVSDTLPFSPDIALVNTSQSQTVVRETTQRQIADFLVTNITDPQPKGIASSMIVVARDVDGYVIDNYTGTIRFSSTDAGASLPGQYTFTPNDRGVKVFENQVAFSNPGEWTVSVTDDKQVTGAQQDITVLDANRKMPAAMRFLQSLQPEQAPSTASQNITLELADNQGDVTTAPVGGFPVRLTSSSSTGSFATSPSGPWQSELVTTIPYGTSFLNFYYKDPSVKDAVITVTDWKNQLDDAAVRNDTTTIPIRSLYLESSQSVVSKDAFGGYSTSKYLFSSKPDGAIAGKVNTSVSAYRKIDSSAASVVWRTQWLQGATVLSQSSTGPTEAVRIEIPDITTYAGANTFYAVAQAAASSFDDPFSVVSRQLAVPVSSWTGTATVTHESSDVSSPVLAHASFTNKTASVPSTISYAVYRANAPSDGESIINKGYAGGDAPGSFLISKEMLPDAAATYRFVVTAYDAEGNIIAQAGNVFNYSNSVAQDPVAVVPGQGDSSPSQSTREGNGATGSVPASAPSGTVHVIDNGGTKQEQDDPSVTHGDAHVNGKSASMNWWYLALVLLVISVLLQTLREVRRSKVAKNVMRQLNGMGEYGTEATRRHARIPLHDAFFWLPIVLSGMIAYGGIIVIARVSNGDMEAKMAIFFAFILIVALVLLFSLRAKTVKNQINDMQKTLL